MKIPWELRGSREHLWGVLESFLEGIELSQVLMEGPGCGGRGPGRVCGQGDWCGLGPGSLCRAWPE